MIKGYVIKKLFDTYVLMNVSSKTDMIYKLNSTYKDIVECIINGYEKNGICDFLINKYNIDEMTVKSDVDDVIEQLLEKGIISND